MDGEELLTVPEAARVAGVNPQTLRNWREAGLLPMRRLGPRAWVMTRADLDRALAGRPHPGQPRKPKPPKQRRPRGRPRKVRDKPDDIRVDNAAPACHE